MKTINNQIVILISLFCLVATMQANAWTWTAKYHPEVFNIFNGGYVKGNSVVVDAGGNVYVTGTYYYNYNGFPYRGNEITTIKYSSAGVELWVKNHNYVGIGHGITVPGDFGLFNALDNSGNLIVVGVCGDGYGNDVVATISYEPVNGGQNWISHYVTNYEKSVTGMVVNSYNEAVYICGIKKRLNPNPVDDDYFILSYDLDDGATSSGVWPITSDIIGDDGAMAICTDINTGGTNVFVTGYITNGSGNKDVITLGYDAIGDPLTGFPYNFALGSNDDIPASIAYNLHLPNNRLLIAGKTGADPYYDYLILAYRADGLGLVNSRNPTNSPLVNDEATSVSINNSNGKIYVTGGTNDDGFNNLFTMTTIAYNDDLSILNPGVNFNRFPHTQGGSDYGKKVKVGSNGDVYICGYSLNKNTGFTEYSVFRYGPALTLKAKSFYNGSLSDGFGIGNYSEDKAYDLCIDASGRPIVTGYSEEKIQGSCMTTVQYGKYIYVTWSSFLPEGAIGLPRNVGPFELITHPLNLSAVGDTIALEGDTVGSGKWDGYLMGDSLPIQPFYISIKGKNTIETWSATSLSFVGDSLYFDFTTSQSQAFGNNMIQVNGKWCFYSGDVNQDEIVDASDASLVDNDLYNFVFGYVNTDVTGDGFVDASDMSIIDNNAYNFVMVVRP